MDSVEEAGTAANLNHIVVPLQTLEAADQLYCVPDVLVVFYVRSWYVHLVVGDCQQMCSQLKSQKFTSGVHDIDGFQDAKT